MQIGVKLDNTGVFPFCFVKGAAPAVADEAAAIASPTARILLNLFEIFFTPL